MPRKPSILIHVEDRRRDALVCVLLAKLLRRMGNRVYLCNRVTGRLYWNQIQPDVMLVPFVWTGVRGPEELEHRARKTRIMVLPTEGMVTTGEEWVRDYARAYDPSITLDADTRTRYSRHITRALLWGEAAKRALVEGGALDESQVTITGSCRLDYFHPDISLDDLNPGSGAPAVGFVGGFPPINIFDQRSVFQTIDGLRAPQARGKAYDQDGNLEDLFWWYYAGARLYLELLDEWILERHGEANLRPHPFEYFGSYAYLQDKYAGRFTLDEPLNPFPLWFASVSALVINRSTSTTLPAFFTGKPVITVQNMVHIPFAKFREHERYNTALVDHCYKPRTVAEAADLLEAAVHGELKGADVADPDLVQLLRDQLDWPRDEFSLSSIAREVDGVAREAAEANGAGAATLRAAKATALPYALRVAVKARAWRRRRSAGSRQVDDLSRFWPWHRYEWGIGERFFQAMLPKMMQDLQGTGSRQPAVR